jgi:acyl carrier protein
MIRVKKILSNVLGVDASTITDDMSSNSVESWDSFTGLMLMSELEREFGISFSLDDVTSVTKVGDIYLILHKHDVSLEA